MDWANAFCTTMADNGKIVVKGSFCSACGCSRNKNQDRELSFFRFPKYKERFVIKEDMSGARLSPLMLICV